MDRIHRTQILMGVDGYVYNCCSPLETIIVSLLHLWVPATDRKQLSSMFFFLNTDTCKVLFDRQTCFIYVVVVVVVVVNEGI